MCAFWLERFRWIWICCGSEKELRWQLGNPEREDLTLRLWLEMIGEDRV